MFQSKRGERGWPEPQAARIERYAERFGFSVSRKTAQTGTIYLTISDLDENSVTVRCADHADAYCTADYTVDPAIDQRKAVNAWIAEHGDESEYRARVAARREYTALVKKIGGPARMADGSEWHAWPASSKIDGSDDVYLVRARQQAERGFCE